MGAPDRLEGRRQRAEGRAGRAAAFLVPRPYGYLRVMRIAALLALLASLALAPSASAATACDHPASAYSTGAPADVSNPGPQPVNDPIFPDQWGLTTISAPQAWARGDRGSGAIIAVVDTGADLTHPDLKANL